MANFRVFAKDGTQQFTIAYAPFGSFNAIEYIGNNYFFIAGGNPMILTRAVDLIKVVGRTAYRIKANFVGGINGNYRGIVYDGKNMHVTFQITLLPPRYRYRVYTFINRTADLILGQTNNKFDVGGMCSDGKYFYTVRSSGVINPTIYQFYVDNAKNTIKQITTTTSTAFANTPTGMIHDGKQFIFCDDNGDFVYMDDKFSATLQTYPYGGRALSDITTDGKYIYGVWKMVDEINTKSLKETKEIIFNALKTLAPDEFGTKVWADVESFDTDENDTSFFRITFKEDIVE